MRVLIECNADKIFIQVLGIPKRNIEHAGGKGNICRKLSRFGKYIGLMDEDPNTIQSRYLENLIQSQNIEPQHRLKIIHDRDRRNLIIIVCPRLEEWILDAAEEAGVSLTDFGLPETADRLHQVNTLRPVNWQRALHELLKRSTRLQYLQRVIRKYTASCPSDYNG